MEDLRSKDILKKAINLFEQLDNRKLTAEQGNAMVGALRQANNAKRHTLDKANLKMKLHRHNIAYNSNIQIDE